MTSQDRAIVATLTTTPQWVEEWQEYAALDDGGVLHTAEDKRKLAATLAEANELIARHAHVNVMLAETKENHK